jgi:hypothetical protein
MSEYKSLGIKCANGITVGSLVYKKYIIKPNEAGEPIVEFDENFMGELLDIVVKVDSDELVLYGMVSVNNVNQYVNLTYLTDDQSLVNPNNPVDLMPISGLKRYNGVLFEDIETPEFNVTKARFSLLSQFFEIDETGEKLGVNMIEKVSHEDIYFVGDDLTTFKNLLDDHISSMGESEA